MGEGNTSSCNKDTLSIVRVDTGTRIAKSLRTRIHLGGFICLQIHRHEVPLQATRIHARGNVLEMAKFPKSTNLPVKCYLS